jgi:hypothetical protein
VKQVSVPVEDDVYAEAKRCAKKEGMLFSGWVQRAIANACDRSPVAPVRKFGLPSAEVTSDGGR